MSMGVAPIPNTQIPKLAGYNTHTHSQNTQVFIGILNKKVILFSLNPILKKKFNLCLNCLR